MVDLVILLILAIAVLAGYYRGVVYSAISLGLTILSFFLALLCIPLLTGSFKNRDTIYPMMLYYFEGYEYISNTSVEMVHYPVTQVTDDELELIVSNADMPIPLDSAVKHNVKSEQYQGLGIYTLGDYFNQTVVDVVINILSLLILFLIIRLLLGFGLHITDYAVGGLPVLQRFDVPISLGIGFLQGVVLVFIIFMLVPVMLSVVPQMSEYIQNSILGRFFYHANLFLRMIPSH
ncbi:MAG: CvpA family protein [Eubacteriales bacterium]|nr:CvpA family protein [Eubacteriales bacterium]